MQKPWNFTKFYLEGETGETLTLENKLEARMRTEN